MAPSPSHSAPKLPLVSDEGTDDQATLLQVHDDHLACLDQCSHDDILDRLLTKVGYGVFQKKLLILCGFGWLADNMWLQSVAIIMPRVQEHFDVSDRWIGVLSSSLFTGMTVGSFFWGTYSDSRGRKLPYTMTLAITSIFGVLSSFAFSFWSLCLCLFFLGFGVGGNMPTDGALYLEFLPKEYHYLLTFMSVFFSFGAVMASMLGYFILPNFSCPELPAPGEDSLAPCDLAKQNRGWRIMLFSVAMTTLLMLSVRSLCVRLPETPKFLLRHDRKQETIIVLRDIARINGGDVRIASIDLDPSCRDRNYNQGDEEHQETYDPQSPTNTPDIDADERVEMIRSNRGSTGKSNSWSLLLSPKWRRTTVLIWGVWTFTSIAFTMFNVFLPKYLETLGFEGEAAPTHRDVYWDYMIYSLAGVPGSVVASYLIETSLGRTGTMACSAFGSSVALFLFTIIDSRATMLVSSSAVSFLATLLYAVIYGYTPELFDTALRGTAVGTASGLGRIAGIISPIVCGMLLTINSVLPLYVSVVSFILVGFCVVLLKPPR